MKKMMMLALVMMLTLTGAALAESAPMSKEDQMKNMERIRIRIRRLHVFDELRP